ncbi:MAG: hypothetical protein IMW83_03760 [Caldanaerobacter subterraneus]|nr:hypothetical protein [Caldanaerobacter subterraneus]
MRRDKLLDIFLWIMFIVTFPFLVVYYAGLELLKKAALVVTAFFGILFGIFLITTAFVALLGDWQRALKETIEYAVSAKNFVFVEIPQDLPNKINLVMGYLKTHSFARNLLIMWLIGFVIQSSMNLLGRYSYYAEARAARSRQNYNESSSHEPDPTDGFTKARFDAYFPEGWQERRQNFFEQVREAKEEIQKRIKKK